MADRDAVAVVFFPNAKDAPRAISDLVLAPAGPAPRPKILLFGSPSYWQSLLDFEALRRGSPKTFPVQFVEKVGLAWDAIKGLMKPATY